MKSSQLLLAAIVAAVVILGAAIVYKSHHKASAPQPGGTHAPVTAAVPAPPPPPTAPATSVKQPGQVKDALKAGLLKPIFYVQEKMAMLQRGLTAALNSRRILLDDLDKLDFATTASTNPYNVFNPNGKVKYAPIDGIWLDQELIDKLTTRKGTPLVYNMHRVTDKDGTSEILYAVIPNIAQANCGVAAGNKEFNSAAPIGVENDPHTIIDDPAGMPVIDVGCVHTPNGIVWLYKLKLRYKHKGQDHWGSR